ncbi:sodium:proline symporter, partial [Bacillus cereus]
MSTQMLTLTSISIYMLGMLVIGYFAYKRTSNLTDYMLGGRTLGPAVTALSAGASDMSGWLLMGLPGAMFSVGLSSS